MAEEKEATATPPPTEAGGEAAAAACDESTAPQAPDAATPGQQDAETAAPETASETVESETVESETTAPGPDWKDRYARLLADFENYKKRIARDRDETFRYAEADVIKDILPVIDNLALALQKAENAEDPFVKGVRMVYDGMLAKLKERDAEPFDSVGKELDISRMEAIAHLPSPEVPEGKVSVESKRGWMLRGKVLRAAQVVVSAGKPE